MGLRGNKNTSTRRAISRKQWRHILRQVVERDYEDNVWSYVFVWCLFSDLRCAVRGCGDVMWVGVVKSQYLKSSSLHWQSVLSQSLKNSELRVKHPGPCLSQLFQLSPWPSSKRDKVWLCKSIGISSSSESSMSSSFRSFKLVSSSSSSFRTGFRQNMSNRYKTTRDYTFVRKLTAQHTLPTSLLPQAADVPGNEVDE